MNETLADILAGMRDPENDYITNNDLRYLADRIEEAAERERGKWERERRTYEKLHDCFWDKNAIQSIVRQMLDARDDLRRVDPKEADDLQYYAHKLMGAAQSALCNAAAMREELEHIEKLTREFNVGNYNRPDYTQWVLDSVRFALAAPVRNCDIGTAEEQVTRFLSVCRDRRHYHNVRKCPLFVEPNCFSLGCFSRWAQMPYEGGGRNDVPGHFQEAGRPGMAKEARDANA